MKERIESFAYLLLSIICVVKGIVPVVEGINIINKIRSTTRTSDVQTYVYSLKSLNIFQIALPSDFELFAHLHE